MPNYKYKTLEGDTWDAIALDFYDNEYLASKIMEANPEHITTLIFPAGVLLKVPVLEESAPASLPPWKRSEAL